MKAEPIGFTLALAAVAATSADPLAAVATGAVAGAVVVALMMPLDTPPIQRGVRAIISILAGVACAIGLFASLGIFGQIHADAETLTRISNLKIERLVSYSMGVVAFVFSLLGHPICVWFFRYGPRVLRGAGDRLPFVGADAGSVDGDQPVRPRRRAAKADHDSTSAE
jgi:hypothetical protein